MIRKLKIPLLAEEQDVQMSVSPRRLSCFTNYLQTSTGYASDELDEPEVPAKKQKLSKAAEAKLKAKAKAKSKKDEDYQDEDEDNYTALSKSMWSSPSKPSVGSRENCAKCEKAFTVVCRVRHKI
jgi:hypothetical protein